MVAGWLLAGKTARPGRATASAAPRWRTEPRTDPKALNAPAKTHSSGSTRDVAAAARRRNRRNSRAGAAARAAPDHHVMTPDGVAMAVFAGHAFAVTTMRQSPAGRDFSCCCFRVTGHRPVSCSAPFAPAACRRDYGRRAPDTRGTRHKTADGRGRATTGAWQSEPESGIRTEPEADPASRTQKIMIPKHPRQTSCPGLNLNLSALMQNSVGKGLNGHRLGSRRLTRKEVAGRC